MAKASYPLHVGDQFTIGFHWLEVKGWKDELVFVGAPTGRSYPIGHEPPSGSMPLASIDLRTVVCPDNYIHRIAAKDV